jgi:hypothetical protein
MSMLLLLLFAALPVLGQESTDRIALRFVVRDEVALKLASPALRLELGTTELVDLVDDGSLEGDTPGDHVWVGEKDLRRVQKLDFTLLDTATGQAQGSASLFLPAADEATITLRTSEGDPPLVIEGEDGASTSGDGTSTAAPAATSAVSESSGDRFTYLLWVVLLLGLLGFGYMRVVVRRIYVQDFLPTWRKLDRWLDRELDG